MGVGGGRSVRGGVSFAQLFPPPLHWDPPTRIHRSVRGDIKRKEVQLFPRPARRIG